MSEKYDRDAYITREEILQIFTRSRDMDAEYTIGKLLELAKWMDNIVGDMIMLRKAADGLYALRINPQTNKIEYMLTDKGHAYELEQVMENIDISPEDKERIEQEVIARLDAIQAKINNKDPMEG